MLEISEDDAGKDGNQDGDADKNAHEQNKSPDTADTAELLRQAREEDVKGERRINLMTLRFHKLYKRYFWYYSRYRCIANLSDIE